MDDMSRVKKNEDLIDSVNDENSASEVDSAVNEMKRRNENTVDYVGIHKKNDESYLVDETGDFKNEYLDSFIQEVKEYNMKKGLKENEDTELDILQQLSAKQRLKRASYMEKDDDELAPKPEEKFVEDALKTLEIEIPKEEVNVYDDADDQVSLTTEEIASQVQELLKDDPEFSQDNVTNNFQAVESAIEEEKPEEIEPDIIEDFKPENSALIFEEDKKLLDNQDQNDNGYTEEYETYTKEQLIEETQQLKVQLDDAKNEISDMNENISKNNKVLNIIIIILVLILLGVIGVVIYWLVSGGIL